MGLKDNLKQSEGFSLHPYKDTLGFWTVYYGHKINPGETFNYTREEAEIILDKDIEIAHAGAREVFPEMDAFSPVRQDTLVELTFNLGYHKIQHGFPRFVHCCNIQHWHDAANELQFADGKSIPSLWYKQVGHTRADRILEQLERRIMILDIIFHILGLIFGPIFKAIKGVFTKSPEERIRKQADEKEINAINSIAVSGKPYIVRPSDDDWAKPKNKEV